MSVTIEPLAWDYDRDRAIGGPVSSLDFLRAGFQAPAATRTPTRAVAQALAKAQALGVPDTAPRAAGWTLLLDAADPRRDELLEILRPLAERRGMADPGKPLLFGEEHRPQRKWIRWYQEVFNDRETVPAQVLILGGPERIPFEFEALLAMVAAVGRIEFDELRDFGAYCDKLLRLEAARQPAVAARALVFATDHGGRDPTRFSHRYMAEPLKRRIDRRGVVQASSLFKGFATKRRLLDKVREQKPALLYTASHGCLIPYRQRQPARAPTASEINGAIVCQPGAAQRETFDATDVPDGPFLEGGVLFQFACFGLGTPALSQLRGWHESVPAKLAREDFVSALPKRLLKHPRGPIGFIGHVDYAWLHGFTPPDDPAAGDRCRKRWHPRLRPFLTAVDRLLDGRPLGKALGELSRRYALLSAGLTSHFTDPQTALDEESAAEVVDQVIERVDAQNYLLFGDPAARLAIPRGSGEAGR